MQEVAARALANGIVFDDAADLMRWAVPVALNLLVDSARHAGRVTVGIDGWDAAVADVADLVSHRDRLSRVLGAVSRLSDADRAALTDGGTESDAPLDRREAVKLAVRRHRARRRLLQLVDGVAGVAGALAALGIWVRRVRPGRVAVSAMPVAFAVPVALVLVSPSPAERPVQTVTTPAVAGPAAPRLPKVLAGPAKGAAARATRVAPVAPRTPALVAAVVNAPRPVPRREVVHVGSGRNRAAVVSRPRTQDDSVLCVHVQLPHLGEPCVG